MAAETSRCLCKNDLTDDGRRVIASLIVNWGSVDERADWAGEKQFCSFGCLRDWAAEMAVAHDGRAVVEGVVESGVEPKGTA